MAAQATTSSAACPSKRSRRFMTKPFPIPNVYHRGWVAHSRAGWAGRIETHHVSAFAIPSELPHQVRRDLGEAADAHQRQIAVALVAQQRDGALAGSLAAGDRGVEKRPADEDEMRTERERLEHVGAAADDAVDHHRPAL